MPIYMDRHDLAVTAKDVAEAHREDVKIQHKYHCKGLTYWFDEKRGSAFCLVEAPNADCVKNMHDNAHGLVPHQIIEVESSVVNAFLGRITDPQSNDFLADSNLPIINESAYRIIMFICLKDIFVLKSTIDNEKAIEIINSARDFIQKSINKFNGREVNKDSKRLIISFTSGTNAVMSALEIQREMKSLLKNAMGSSFNINISLCAGLPVTSQNELFGESVQLAKRLCEVANQEQVMISSEVRDVYNSENINGLSPDVHAQILSPDDEEFINKLIDTTESIWNDPQFDVGIFGKQVGLSRSQFYRKVSSITGLSPNEYIRDFRLKKALNLIETKKGNVAQIAFNVGFNSPSYFSKCFQKRFGVLPSNLVK